MAPKETWLRLTRQPTATDLPVAEDPSHHSRRGETFPGSDTRADFPAGITLVAT